MREYLTKALNCTKRLEPSVRTRAPKSMEEKKQDAGKVH
jgi:hypothetical protein